MLFRSVGAERVTFDPPGDYASWLAWFQQVDIVLDSFPGNGGLSLLDALWMGVPVVSRSGSWLGARQGASILHSLGQDDWVADSEAGFIAAAVALGLLIDHSTPREARPVDDRT